MTMLMIVDTMFLKSIKPSQDNVGQFSAPRNERSRCKCNLTFRSHATVKQNVRDNKAQH